MNSMEHYKNKMGNMTLCLLSKLVNEMAKFLSFIGFIYFNCNPFDMIFFLWIIPCSHLSFPEYDLGISPWMRGNRYYD